MAAHYRPDVVVMRSSPVSRGEEIENTNAILERNGLGRLLGDPRAATKTTAVVPTAADPATVRSAVRRLRARGESLPDVDLDYIHGPGTSIAPARGGSIDYYTAAGCQTGHSGAPWLPAPDYAMPKPQAAAGVRRVVALLDTVVRDHQWLSAANHGDPDPFVVPARWKPTEALSNDDGPYAGHGTFNAGLIRLFAPAAKVLSLPVMTNDGHVYESRLVEALDWLAKKRDGAEGVHVICMPFGRPRHDDDDAIDAVWRALFDLRPVKIVSSAGNEGADVPTYPAAFATDPELSVVSVGSSESPTQRAAYSNYGVWVREWRGGSNMVSCFHIPPTALIDERDGFAWWSGTSFAAVRYAAELLTKPGDDLPA